MEETKANLASPSNKVVSTSELHSQPEMSPLLQQPPPPLLIPFANGAPLINPQNSTSPASNNSPTSNISVMISGHHHYHQQQQQQQQQQQNMQRFRTPPPNFERRTNFMNQPQNSNNLSLAHSKMSDEDNRMMPYENQFSAHSNNLSDIINVRSSPNFQQASQSQSPQQYQQSIQLPLPTPQPAAMQNQQSIPLLNQNSGFQHHHQQQQHHHHQGISNIRFQNHQPRGGQP